MPATRREYDSYSRNLRLKTNAIGWCMLISNVALEIDICPHLSFQLPIYYSGMNFFSNRTKFRTFALQPELRLWPGKSAKWFVGAHGGMAYYNFALDGDWRIQDAGGNHPLWGGGIVSGYSTKLSKHLELEFSLGAGIYDAKYDRFYNERNGPYEGTYHKTFIGIDHAAVTLSYRFGIGRRRER